MPVDCARPPVSANLTEVEGRRESLAFTLEWLVRNRELSVQLINCITANPNIGSLTLREFLSDKEGVQRKLLGIRNLGRKTVAELCDLVGKIATPDTQQQLVEVSEPPAKRAFRELLKLLSPIPFPATILQFDISIRLRNGLRDFEAAQRMSGRWEAEVASLSDVLSDWPEIHRRLLARANLGRKTVAELEALVETIVTKRVSPLSLSRDTTPVVAMEDLTENKLSASLVETLLNAAREFK